MTEGLRLAGIDLGSNSIKMSLVEVDATGALRVLSEAAEVTRIGEKLDQNGFLLDEAMDRSFRVLQSFVSQAKAAWVDAMACVATAGMRGADNAPRFIERVQRELGLEIAVIDGEREAELSFIAPSKSFGPGPILVIDMGGRSTELIYGQAGQITAKRSLELGAVRLTEAFLPSDPPTEAELAALDRHIDSVLATAPSVPAEVVVGVSGTVVSLYGLAQGMRELPEVLKQAEGAWLSLQDIEALEAQLAAIPAAARVTGSVLPPGRADVIVAGARLLKTLLKRAQKTGMRVSSRGLRFGLLYAMRDAHNFA